MRLQGSVTTPQSIFTQNADKSTRHEGKFRTSYANYIGGNWQFSPTPENRKSYHILYGRNQKMPVKSEKTYDSDNRASGKSCVYSVQTSMSVMSHIYSCPVVSSTQLLTDSVLPGLTRGHIVTHVIESVTHSHSLTHSLT